MIIEQLANDILILKQEHSEIKDRQLIILEKLKTARLDYFFEKFGAKKGVKVLVYPNSYNLEKGKLAIIDRVDDRISNDLSSLPWIKVRTINNDGNWSKRSIHAFANWRLQNET